MNTDRLQEYRDPYPTDYNRYMDSSERKAFDRLDEPVKEKAFALLSFAEIVTKMNPYERAVFLFRTRLTKENGGKFTQKEVGELIGRSRRAVGRLEKSAYSKIPRYLLQ